MDHSRKFLVLVNPAAGRGRAARARAPVEAYLRSQGVHVGAPIREPIGAPVGANVHANITANIATNVAANIAANVDFVAPTSADDTRHRASAAAAQGYT